MPKALCIAGTVVAVLLFLVFGVDLTTMFVGSSGGFPFGTSMLMDIGFLISAAILGFLSWTTLREQS